MGFLKRIVSFLFFITVIFSQTAFTDFNFSKFESDIYEQELSSLMSRQYDDFELSNKKISLTLKNAKIRDVIDLISKSVGVNFLVDKDVKGVVRKINFQDTPVSVALRKLLNNNVPRLALTKDCGLFRVSKFSDVKNTLVGRRTSNFEFAIISLLNIVSFERKIKKIESLWQGIIGGNIGKPGFYLVVDQECKKVFCRGKRHHIAYFKKFLSEIDNDIPQVKIEARFVCTEKGFEENIGFQWSGIYNRRSSINRGFDFVGVGRPLSDINNDPKQQAKVSLVDWALNFLPTPDKVAKAIRLPFVFGGKNLNTRRLNLVLNAAEDRNEIKTILKPSILASDGQMAEILVGENVPIETIVEEVVEGRLRNTKTADYKDIGIQLKVKPAVSAGKNTVYLDVFIENSQQKDSVRSGQTTYPVIQTTRSHTKVRLKSGQTTMISSLIRDVKENFNTNAPLLSELPFIGWLFRGSRKRKQDMQLLIFITPTVI